MSAPAARSEKQKPPMSQTDIDSVRAVTAAQIDTYQRLEAMKEAGQVCE